MSNARERDWKMVRLLRVTAKQLDEWREVQAGKNARGIETAFWNRTSGAISYDACVRELLARDEAHRQRSKRAHQKKKAKQKSETPRRRRGSRAADPAQIASTN